MAGEPVGEQCAASPSLLICIGRYPGCACDIPSVNYQVRPGLVHEHSGIDTNTFQFTWARKPWTHFYSYSEEIWRYFRDVAEQFDLLKYMKLRHEIIGAYWDDESGLWNIKIKNLVTGTEFTDTAEIFINGGGILK